MKTAISLPDDLFAAADAFAARHGQSRSSLFAEALREYLARHDSDQITRRLDALAAELDTTLPRDGARSIRQLHLRESW